MWKVLQEKEDSIYIILISSENYTVRICLYNVEYQKAWQLKLIISVKFRLETEAEYWVKGVVPQNCDSCNNNNFQFDVVYDFYLRADMKKKVRITCAVSKVRA